MNCDALRDDLEAFALNALDPDETRAAEEHIAGCDRCAQVVRAYRPAIDHLALAVPLYRARPRLKQRIMGAVGVNRPTGIARVLTSRYVQGLAAASVAALIIGASAWVSMLTQQVENLRNDNALLAELTQLDAQQRTALLRLQGDLNSARTEQKRMSTTLDEQATLLVLALDPDLVPTDLQGTNLAPEARCSYVWSSKQSVGALTCRDLPSTSFALTYELWVDRGETTTVPLGSFVPRIDGTAALLVKFPDDAPGPITNLWVTLEDQGSGRPNPSKDIVLQRAPANQAQR